MKRIIMHIDVNNAFLSWSAIDFLNNGFKKDIREEDAVIGGDESKRHGVVLAKSISAKKKGIITGESLYSAKKKCIGLNIYPPNYQIYEEMSNRLFELLSKYTPDIEILSIDECFIDYSKVKNLYGGELQFAYKLKDEIKNKLGFTVNIGVGNNKLCAKMASDFQKPDRVHTLYLSEIKNKMWPLSIGELYGVGKKTSAELRKININTIGDLANSNLDELYKYFKNQAYKMVEKANGVDNSEVSSDVSIPKGISNSVTMPKDLTTKESVYKVLHRISEKISTTLRSHDKSAYVITVKLKDRYFNSYSHQMKLKNATNITSEIYKVSKKLFDEMWNQEPIRLVGIALTNLVINDYYQLSLFEDVSNRDINNRLDKTVDKLKKRYGENIISVASLINNKKRD